MLWEILWELLWKISWEILQEILQEMLWEIFWKILQEILWEILQEILREMLQEILQELLQEMLWEILHEMAWGMMQFTNHPWASICNSYTFSIFLIGRQWHRLVVSNGLFGEQWRCSRLTMMTMKTTMTRSCRHWHRFERALRPFWCHFDTKKGRSHWLTPRPSEGGFRDVFVS